MNQRTNGLKPSRNKYHDLKPSEQRNTAGQRRVRKLEMAIVTYAVQVSSEGASLPQTVVDLYPPLDDEDRQLLAESMYDMDHEPIE